MELGAIETLADQDVCHKSYTFSWLPLTEKSVLNSTNNSKWSTGELRQRIKGWTCDVVDRMEGAAVATCTRLLLTETAAQAGDAQLLRRARLLRREVLLEGRSRLPGEGLAAQILP